MVHLVSRGLLQRVPQLQVHPWLPLEAQRKPRTFWYSSHLVEPVIEGVSLHRDIFFFLF